MTVKTQRELQMDREANYFAVCLLMPADMLKRDVATMYPDGLDLVDGKEIKTLAKRYQVSVTLMTARLMELGVFKT